MEEQKFTYNYNSVEDYFNDPLKKDEIISLKGFLERAKLKTKDYKRKLVKVSCFLMLITAMVWGAYTWISPAWEDVSILIRIFLVGQLCWPIVLGVLWIDASTISGPSGNQVSLKIKGKEIINTGEGASLYMKFDNVKMGTRALEDPSVSKYLDNIQHQGRPLLWFEAEIFKELVYQHYYVTILR